MENILKDAWKNVAKYFQLVRKTTGDILGKGSVRDKYEKD